MRLMRWFVAVFALAVLVAIGTSFDPAGASDDHDGGSGHGSHRECAGRNGPADPALRKTILINGESAEGRTTVAPGDVVEATLTWDPAIFTGVPRKIVDCVYSSRASNHRIGVGRRLRDLETIEKPMSQTTATNGRWTTSYKVPKRLVGRLLCDRGRIYGPGGVPGAKPVRSNEICVTVQGGPPPVIPELPVPALALAVTLAVGTGSVVVLRRRRSIA
jgi:hypothetical protein